MIHVTHHSASWRNGERVGLLIRRFWVRVPARSLSSTFVISTHSPSSPTRPHDLLVMRELDRVVVRATTVVNAEETAHRQSRPFAIASERQDVHLWIVTDLEPVVRMWDGPRTAEDGFVWTIALFVGLASRSRDVHAPLGYPVRSIVLKERHRCGSVAQRSVVYVDNVHVVSNWSRFAVTFCSVRVHD